ncbi:MAG: nusB family protein [Micavibrio sp.]|nr:nusB family protein [Micavibrio sp.]
MTSTQPKKPQGSKKAQAAAARLAAVQAVYQILTNEQDAQSVLSEYKLHRLGKDIDGEAMVTPDGVLLEAVVTGVYDRMNALEDAITSAFQKAGKSKPAEPLLISILLCGAYELLAHLDIDAPLIVSDYLNVTHAFYEQGEAKLVNGILDTIKKAIRS